ncbi:RAD51-associated protein 2 [Ambystoma mexicanum]|uniref:RAD51-associated protein 2 n=1 Tax=Ambystoma mexicanum TaxID=8296 RepID=UPI0037E88447
MSLQHFPEILFKKNEFSLAAVHNEIEDIHMMKNEEDTRVCCIDELFKCASVPVEAQHSNEHSGFGDWELVQLFNFSRQRNPEEADPKSKHLKNDYQNRDILSNVNIPCTFNSEKNECSSYVPRTYRGCNINIANDSALSLQREPSVTDLSHMLYVNKNYKGNEKLPLPPLCTTETNMIITKNDEMKPEKVSTFFNKDLSQFEILDQKEGANNRDNCAGVKTFCEKGFIFPTTKSMFGNITANSFHVGLKKPVPNILDSFKQLQNPTISMSLLPHPSSSFKSKKTLEIVQHNLLCMENRPSFRSASSRLQCHIPQVLSEREFIQGKLDCPSYGVQSLKSQQNWLYAETQSTQKNTNIAKHVCAFSELCKNSSAYVCNQVAQGIPKDTNSCYFMSGRQKYVQRVTRKNLKRRLPAPTDEWELRSKRYLMFPSVADSIRPEVKKSANADNSINARSQKVTSQIAIKFNECASPFVMMGGKLKHGRGNCNENLGIHKKVVCLNPNERIFSMDDAFDLQEHFYLPTLLPNQAPITPVFHVNTHVPYASSYGTICTYLIQHKERGNNACFIVLFESLTLGSFNVREKVMSKNNDSEIECWQAATFVHPWLDGLFIIRARKWPLYSKQELLSKIQVLDPFKEDENGAGVSSDQEVWRYLTDHKSIQICYVKCPSFDGEQYIFGSNGDIKETLLMHLGVLGNATYKKLLKECNNLLYGKLIREDLLGICNTFLTLFDATHVRNICSFTDPMILTDNVSGLCSLISCEKCVAASWNADLPEKYATFSNDVSSISEFSFRNGFGFNYLPHKFVDTCNILALNVQEIKDLQKSEVHCFDSIIDIHQKISLTALSLEEIKDFQKSEVHCFDSIIDIHQKIPLTSKFEDLEGVALSSKDVCEEYIEITLFDNAKTHSYQCSDIVKASGAPATFLSVQMSNSILVNRNKELPDYDQGDINNGQCLENKGLFENRSSFDPRSCSRVKSVPGNECFHSILSEDKDIPLSKLMTMDCTEHYQELSSEDDKQWRTVSTSMRVSDNTNATFKNKNVLILNKSPSAVPEEWQKDIMLFNASSESLNLLTTSVPLQDAKETECQKPCTNQKNIVQVSISETMLTSTMLSEFCCLSAQGFVKDLGVVNAKGAKEILYEDKTKSTFTMKSQFDLVLEELTMFHEISKEHEEESYHETSAQYKCAANNIGEYDLRMKKNNTESASEKTITSSEAYDTLKKQTKYPGLCKRKVETRKEEQKVPDQCLYSNVTEDESLYFATNEGDFNLGFNDPNDQHALAISNLLAETGFTQRISQATHIKGRTLDWVADLKCAEAITTITPLIWTDHFQISFPLPTKTLSAKIKPIASPVTTRNQRNITTDKVIPLIVPTLNSLSDSASPDKLVDAYNNIITKPLDTIAPLKMQKSKPKAHLNSWFTLHLKSLRLEKRKLETLRKLFPTDENKNNLINLATYYKKEIIRSKQESYNERITKASSNSNELFTILREMESPIPFGVRIFKMPF